MKTTLSVIKADIGSIGGHIAPSNALLETVRHEINIQSNGLISDYYLSYTGDDIAILMVHKYGVNNEAIHKLAWNAFIKGTETAKAQGLYGAGQDILKDAFSGNVRGMGPAVTELEFVERPGEPFLSFWDTVRQHVTDKAINMRRQGFLGAAMLPMNELEYTGITQKLQMLDEKFTIRPG